MNDPILRTSNRMIDYPTAVSFMEDQVAAIRAGESKDLIWFLEHPPMYTAGTSAISTELISPDRFPVYKTGRGGKYTYHGPGQRIVYVMMDLKNRGSDIRVFINHLEEWVIQTLAKFDVKGERRKGRIGIWVNRRHDQYGVGQEDKIAAIGIRVRNWVSYHGFSINVEPNLEHYSGIIPCGISGHGVTSLVDLGVSISITDVDTTLIQTFSDVFN